MSKGFTFIELVISSAIFGLIMVGLYFAFSTGMFGYRHIADSLNVSYRALKAMETMNADLRNSFAYLPEKPLFSGNKTQVRFFTLEDTFRQGTKHQDYALVSYSVDRGMLLRLVLRNQDSMRNNTSVNGPAICSAVKDIAFSYADFDAQADVLEWKDAWEANQTLPVAVKVTLSLTGSKESQNNFERTVLLPAANDL